MNEDYYEEESWEKEYDDGCEESDEKEEDDIVVTLSSGLKVRMTQEQYEKYQEKEEIKPWTLELTAKEIYSVLESIAYYNNVSKERFNSRSEEKCCCCGEDRNTGRIVCSRCYSIWEQMSEINDKDREFLYHRIELSIKDITFLKFYSAYWEIIDKFVPVSQRFLLPVMRDKQEKIAQLARCLRQIEGLKFTDSRYIDDLISSVAQRWNILEETS